MAHPRAAMGAASVRPDGLTAGAAARRESPTRGDGEEETDETRHGLMTLTELELAHGSEAGSQGEGRREKKEWPAASQISRSSRRILFSRRNRRKRRGSLTRLTRARLGYLSSLVGPFMPFASVQLGRLGLPYPGTAPPPQRNAHSWAIAALLFPLVRTPGKSLRPAILPNTIDGSEASWIPSLGSFLLQYLGVPAPTGSTSVSACPSDDYCNGGQTPGLEGADGGGFGEPRSCRPGQG